MVAPPAAIRLFDEIAPEVARERHAVVVEGRVPRQERRRRHQDLAASA